MDEMNMAAIEEVAAVILPKLVPKLGMIKTKLKEFLGEGDTIIQIRTYKGRDDIYILIIDATGIKKMEIDKEKIQAHGINVFFDLVANNDVEALFKKFAEMEKQNKLST